MIRLLNAYPRNETLLLGISRSLPDHFRACGIHGSGKAGRPAKPELMLTYQYGSVKILFVAVAFLTCMYYFDLYDSAIVSNRREALVRLIQVLGVAYIALGLLYYLYPPVKLGRGIFHLGFLFVGLLLLLWRRLFAVINSTQGLSRAGGHFGRGLAGQVSPA